MLFDFLRKKDDIIKEVEHPVTHTGADGMPVEDVFTIKGRGTVVTGRVEGTIMMNDQARILRGDAVIAQTRITGIEAFHKTLDMAEDGDNAGLLLEGIARDDVQRGDYIEII